MERWDGDGRTKRTWTSTEKNALSILRNTADLHGGDLVFDCPNRLVHLLTVNGRDSGALFAYRKMKSIQRVVDTRELVTRLYAVGAEGMTFADINGGKAYVEISPTQTRCASPPWTAPPSRILIR